MTRAEVTEIFAVLMMAYPNAEMFKAPDKDSLKAKLAPTITLWTTCLRDIDFWAAQQAVIRPYVSAQIGVVGPGGVDHDPLGYNLPSGLVAVVLRQQALVQIQVSITYENVTF